MISLTAYQHARHAFITFFAIFRRYYAYCHCRRFRFCRFTLLLLFMSFSFHAAAMLMLIADAIIFGFRFDTPDIDAAAADYAISCCRFHYFRHCYFRRC